MENHGGKLCLNFIKLILGSLNSWLYSFCIIIVFFLTEKINLNYIIEVKFYDDMVKVFAFNFLTDIWF